MAKFNKIYEQLINNIQIQKIHNPELHAIPDQFWFKYCDELIKHRNLARKVLKQLQLKQQKDKNISILDIKNSDKIIFSISYQDILNDLDGSLYKEAALFKQNIEKLSKLNNKLYIIICDGNKQHLQDLLSLCPIKQEISIINNIKISRIESFCQNLLGKLNNNSLDIITTAGLSFKRNKPLLQYPFENIYVYLNINLFDIKNTFDHQLTHIVEYIIYADINQNNTSIENELTKNQQVIKFYNINSPDIQYFFNQLIDKFNIQDINLINQLYKTSYLLKEKEFNSVQKSIIAGFKQMYTFQNREEKIINNKLKIRNNFNTIEQQEKVNKIINQEIINKNQENRQKFLDKYLIGTKLYFSTNEGQQILIEFEENISYFQNLGFDNVDKNFQLQLNKSKTIIYYHLFKIIYPDYNIDEIIRNDFKLFKFRES